jgi:LuxR family transcriptional regulator, maltose regulon positive regulatory protein
MRQPRTDSKRAAAMEQPARTFKLTMASVAGNPRRLVSRRGLFDVLDRAVSGRVTVVSAPPGSGKTLLLRSWIDHTDRGQRVAWVSVERGEQDAQRFWLSLVSALCAALGDDPFLGNLTPSPEFDGGAVVERLVSELSSLDEQVVLVIDDLHELRSADALAQLELLLSRLPRALHVILATRRDPQLGLRRLRLAGELTEIRAADLRFTLEESRELLDAAERARELGLVAGSARRR